ncbi:protein artemis-like isoform X2 [Varroa destructor]|nr:protein artemis-like isoform X2 [Varroa destructor]
MSTFPGRIPELPGIMIDKLEADASLNAFFISHDHADHKRGITDPNFQEFMKCKTSQRKIYVSPITAQMLLNREELTFLHEFIIALELDTPHEIRIRTSCSAVLSQSDSPLVGRNFSINESETIEYTLTVTLTSAEHIMGSVMFLFEKTIEPKVANPLFRCLYTGDFRLTIDEIRSKRCLQDRSRSGVPCAKVFDAVYFDSTWCTPRNLWSIPRREDVLEELGPIVKRHLAAKAENIVCLYTNYNIGYENLLRWLANFSESKIHVNESRLMLYRGFPGIQDIFTTNTDCRVHFCQEGPPQTYRSCERVRHGFKTTVLRLKASYMWFIKACYINAETSTCMRNPRFPNEYNVCWSTHSSLEEIMDLLDYLNPSRACPNVVDKRTNETEILDLLRRRATTPKAWHPNHPLDSFEPPQLRIQAIFPKKLSPKKFMLDSSVRRDMSSSSDEDSPEETLEERLRKKGRLAVTPKPRKTITLDHLRPS